MREVCEEKEGDRVLGRRRTRTLKRTPRACVQPCDREVESRFRERRLGLDCAVCGLQDPYQVEARSGTAAESTSRRCDGRDERRFAAAGGGREDCRRQRWSELHSIGPILTLNQARSSDLVCWIEISGKFFNLIS